MKAIMKFLNIIRCAFGGIVGNVIGLSTDRSNIGKKFAASFEQSITDGNSAVDVKQKKLFL